MSSHQRRTWVIFLLRIYSFNAVFIHWYYSLKHYQYHQLRFTEQSVQFSSLQSLSRVRLFATPWTAGCQASPSITNSLSLPKLMSIESVMPSNHLILCYPLLLLPSIFPNIRVFSNESVLCIRWPKHWSFSFNIRPSNETQIWSPLGWRRRTPWSPRDSQESSPTPQFKSMNSLALSSLYSNSQIHTWLPE